MDQLAIAAIGDVYKGTDKPFVVTSVINVVDKHGALATEDDAPNALGFGALRAPAEDLTISLATHGVRATIIRLPPSVHGPGDKAFITSLVGIARKAGVSVFVGDGAARWPAVFRTDVARLYRLALEKGTAGARYNAVGDQGISTKEISEAIGKGLGVPVVSKGPEEAAEVLGPFFAHALQMDGPTSSEKTKAELGWKLEGPGLLADIAAGHYFDPSAEGKLVHE